MDYLVFIIETLTNGYKSEVLSVISIFAIFCAISVIINKNPIVSILFLIGLFSGIAIYLIILGMSFIGLSYLIVYVGAVSILFLFILMLINIRISELQSNNSNSIPLGLTALMLLSYLLFPLLPYGVAISNSNDLFSINKALYNLQVILENSYNLLFMTNERWDGNLVEISHITNIGNIMYTNYNMWLIITSLILLLAMVGAIVITIKQKN